MNKYRFSEILKEHNYSDKQIGLLWNSKPNGNIEEEALRRAAVYLANKKDSLVQE